MEREKFYTPEYDDPSNPMTAAQRITEPSRGCDNRPVGKNAVCRKTWVSFTVFGVFWGFECSFDAGGYWLACLKSLQAV